MGTLHRIKFHTRMAIKGAASRLKETMHPETDEEILAELEKRADSVTPEEKEEIERTFQEHEDNEPVLDLEKTMLIHSRPDEHGCNAFTVALIETVAQKSALSLKLYFNGKAQTVPGKVRSKMALALFHLSFGGNR